MRVLLIYCFAALRVCVTGMVVMVCVTLIAKSAGALIASCFSIGEVAPTAVVFFLGLAIAGWAVDRFWPEAMPTERF